MENNINITLNVGEIKQILQDKLGDIINSTIEANKANIQTQLNKYFSSTSIFSNNENEMGQAVDWAVESLYREAVTETLNKLEYKEHLKTKIEEILTDEDFIHKLAVEKVKKSLGM
jgi:hypothetical protein